MTIPTKMKAVVYHGKKDLRVEQIPVPRIGPNEILVRVSACGVCPTDIKKIQYGLVPGPRVFGHETAGTVVKLGARVRGISAGDRVGLHHHVPCLNCHACRHHAFAQCNQYKKTGITAGFEPAGGGYAEYVRVMPFCLPGVVKIPSKNSFLEGAMLEPVNTVLKGVNRLNVLPGDKVLVAGQGPIGLLFTKLLALKDIKVVATDLYESRLRTSRKWGAWKTLQPNQTEAFMGKIAPKGLDAAVITVPSDPVVYQAEKLLRGGGQLLLFAHTRRGEPSQVDFSTICVDEKDYLGSYSSDFTLQEVVAGLVFSGKIPVLNLITDIFPLEKTAEAIALAAQPREESFKIVVSPMD
jgi:L-iditol 2-dehydrogenase